MVKKEKIPTGTSVRFGQDENGNIQIGARIKLDDGNYTTKIASTLADIYDVTACNEETEKRLQKQLRRAIWFLGRRR